MFSISNSRLSSSAGDGQDHSKTVCERRRWRLAPGRRGLLLGILAALILVLAGYYGPLRLSYDLMAARQALREANANSALEILQRRADRGCQSAEWNFLTARALRNADQFADSEKLLARARELGWNPEDIRREELLTKSRRGEVKKVEAELAALLDSQPSDEVAEEIYKAMAQGYWASFYIGDALQCLEFWSKWQPNNVVPRIWMADLYERTKRPEAAIPEYRKILELDPNNELALSKLGNMLLMQLDLQEAAKTFMRLLSVSPEAAEGLLGLADCLRRDGSIDDAKELLLEALTLELDQRQAARATGMLGTMALEEHDYERAIRLLRDSIAIDRNDAAIHVALAGALTATGQDELAAAERQFARETSDRHSQLVRVTGKASNDPKNPDLRCEAGQLLMQQGFWTEGANWVKTALVIDPQHATAHTRMAEYYEHIGDLKLARQHRAAAVGTEPSPASTDEGG